MSAGKYEIAMNGDARKVQSKGEVTLPKQWRDDHGIEHGDDVVFYEHDDGTLEVIPPE